MTNNMTTFKCSKRAQWKAVKGRMRPKTSNKHLYMKKKCVNTCVQTRWVYVQLEKKEKEGRVLKYFQVENDVMSFMELRGRR